MRLKGWKWMVVLSVCFPGALVGRPGTCFGQALQVGGGLRAPVEPVAVRAARADKVFVGTLVNRVNDGAWARAQLRVEEPIKGVKKGELVKVQWLPRVAGYDAPEGRKGLALLSPKDGDSYWLRADTFDDVGLAAAARKALGVSEKSGQKPAPDARKRMKPGATQDIVVEMDETVELTDEQKARLTALVKARDEAIRKINEDFEAQARALLTAEQQAKWDEAQARKVPADWVRIRTREFTFSAPPTLREEKVQGIDSVVHSWRSDTLHLNSDYGWYSNSLRDRDKPAFSSEKVKVGGKDATLVTFQDDGPAEEGRFCAAIHFPQVTDDGRVKLTVFARCKDAQSQQVARKILLTIVFPH